MEEDNNDNEVVKIEVEEKEQKSVNDKINLRGMVRAPFFHKERFWTLKKGAYLNAKIFCKNCNEFNYKNSVFTVRNNRLYETRSFCEKCTSANLSISHIIYTVNQLPLSK